MLFFKRRQDNNALTLEHSTPVHHAEGYLTGQLLVATPMLTESIFSQAVIYLFAHSEDGAMGVVVNHPMEVVQYDALLDDGSELSTDTHEDVPVYYGGPVDRARGFVLHSHDYHNDDVLHRGDSISVSANTNILRDMVQDKGPRHSLLAVGYAGWSPGQLEKEIEENSWITVPATPELVFHMDDEMKWGMASQSLGIDMHFFSPMVGHA